MQSFSYKITDEVGIHARPAGLLVKKACEFKSDTTLTLGEKTVDAKKIFSVMSLGAKKDHEICIEINGEDEEVAKKELEEFFKTNL